MNEVKKKKCFQLIYIIDAIIRLSIVMKRRKKNIIVSHKSSEFAFSVGARTTNVMIVNKLNDNFPKAIQ